MKALKNVKLSSKSAFYRQDHQSRIKDHPQSHQKHTMETLKNVNQSSKSALCLQDHYKSHQRSSKVASKPDHANASKREPVVQISSLSSRSSKVASKPDHANAKKREPVVQISSLPSRSSQVASKIIKSRIKTRPCKRLKT